MTLKKLIGTLFIAIIGAIIAVFVYTRVIDTNTNVISVKEQPVDFTHLPADFDPEKTFDFTYAAEKTVNAVVHVKTESVRETYYRNPLYEFFYGERFKESEAVIGFGSGVIISEDGYIVTNNHVINNSEKIYVTLNDKREFEAKLLGSDPSTDLAVLKIEEKNLPFVEYGNSDKLRVGEWVLAVGNPFNLTSTVTAGIVSAKGRNLGIIEDQYRLESFIQTDAALNRGNSGGALVNIKGELIGINTAIISPSGGSVGNSFAIPTSIVKKVAADISEFGAVQRAILGITIQDITAELAKEKGFDQIVGIYINGLRDDGAARDAGLKVGDVIISINEVNVNSTAELQEQVSRYRPGDKVDVTVLRDNKKKQFEVVLRNMQGEIKLVKANETLQFFGAEFRNASGEEKKNLGIQNGVKITNLKNGKLMSEGVKEGFIITHINNQPVYDVNDLKSIIDKINGGVYIQGVYPNGVIAYYAFGM